MGTQTTQAPIDMSEGRLRVYIAMSLDGFIAGPDHDLSWLDGADPDAPSDVPPAHIDPDALSYEDFMSTVGALLMGRSTYDVVRGFDVPWPYGETPVLVATTRPLDPDAPSTVRAVAGTISDIVAEAKEAANGQDVYLDGGTLIRAAAEERLIDDMTITVAPVAIGAGHPLFAGLTQHYTVDFGGHHSFMGMVQLRATPRRSRPGES